MLIPGAGNAALTASTVVVRFASARSEGAGNAALAASEVVVMPAPAFTVTDGKLALAASDTGSTVSDVGMPTHTDVIGAEAFATSCVQVYEPPLLSVTATDMVFAPVQSASTTATRTAAAGGVNDAVVIVFAPVAFTTAGVDASSVIEEPLFLISAHALKMLPEPALGVPQP